MYPLDTRKPARSFLGRKVCHHLTPHKCHDAKAPTPTTRTPRTCRKKGEVGLELGRRGFWSAPLCARGRALDGRQVVQRHEAHLHPARSGVNRWGKRCQSPSYAPDITTRERWQGGNDMTTRERCRGGNDWLWNGKIRVFPHITRASMHKSATFSSVAYGADIRQNETAGPSQSPEPRAASRALMTRVWEPCKTRATPNPACQAAGQAHT